MKSQRMFNFLSSHSSVGDTLPQTGKPLTPVPLFSRQNDVMRCYLAWALLNGKISTKSKSRGQFHKLVSLNFRMYKISKALVDYHNLIPEKSFTFSKKHITWAQEIFGREVSQYLSNYNFNLISVDWMRVSHGRLLWRLCNKTIIKLQD